MDFYRDWESYRLGFGDPAGEFWLGNDNLHRLTAVGDHELRIDITDTSNRSFYAVYDTFGIANGLDMYRLTLGGYSGTSGMIILNSCDNQCPIVLCPEHFDEFYSEIRTKLYLISKN